MANKVKIVVALITCVIVFSSLCALAETRIRCASTTSVKDSGLFDYILPLFEKKTGIKVDLVDVGTGVAIAIGKRGDADVVLVHDKEAELKAVDEGFFVNRHDVMYNDFIILGPADDPAKIKGITAASEAFKRLTESGRSFVSWADDSGTNVKELSIWQKAGIDPKGQKWYIECGNAMVKTLRIANEKRAYTLIDRGTWLANKDKLEMVIVLEGDPVLFNQYGVMAVNPEKYEHVRYKEAMEFINWLISKEGQQAIASLKDRTAIPFSYPMQNNRMSLP
jgi:tungstate transport system substrate-binding protein